MRFFDWQPRTFKQLVAPSRTRTKATPHQTYSWPHSGNRAWAYAPQPRAASLGALLFALCCGLFATAQSGAQTPPVVTLNIGFYTPGLREINPGDMRVTFGILADELGGAFKLKTESHFYESMEDLRRDVDAGKLHMVSAPPMELIETFRENELGTGFVGERPYGEDGLAVVVRRNAGIHSMRDLRGRKLRILSNDRLSSVYSEILCHRAYHRPCEQALLIESEKKQNQAIFKVFFDQADAAIVGLYALDIARELNPQIAEKIEVLDSIRMPTRIPMFLLRATDQALQDRVVSSSLEAIKTELAKRMLVLFRATAFTRIPSESLRPARALLREFKEYTAPPPKR